MSWQLRFTQDTWKQNSISTEESPRKQQTTDVNVPGTSDVPITRSRTQNSHSQNSKEASDRISKTSRQKGVPKMTRHEESRAEGRLARGTKLQIEDKWFWRSIAVNSSHTIMYHVFQKGQKKLGMFPQQRDGARGDEFILP